MPDFDNLALKNTLPSGKPPGPKIRSSSLRLPAAQAKHGDGDIDAPAKRIGRTTLPTKFEIVCYECDYIFTLPGHIHDTFCPKCHKPLEKHDHKIETAWSGSVKTIGTFEVTSEGSLGEAHIIARDVILAGDAGTAIIRACRQLELRPGARFDFKKISMKDLAVAEGGRFALTLDVRCRNLEVRGFLKARITCTGVATIRSGGDLRGELEAAALVVEEGGGVKARLRIRR